MPQPYNYILDVPDPTEKVMEGVKQGTFLRNMREQRKAAEIAKQRQAEFNEKRDILSLDSPVEDWVEVSKYLDPEAMKSMMDLYESGTEEQKKNWLQFAQTTYVALNNDPEIGIKQMEEQTLAYRNVGDEENAQALENMIEVAKISPEAAAQMGGVLLGAISPETLQSGLNVLGEKRAGKKSDIDIKVKEGEEEREKQLHPLTIKERKAKIDKLKAETKKLFDEIENVGVITNDQKIGYEDDLKEYYNKRTAAFDNSLRQLSIMSNAALDDSGQGDIALVRSFLLMLEPTSVVRESEFATAAESQGLINKLLMIDDKIKSGEILTPEARKTFVALAHKFLKFGKQKAEQEFWHTYDVSKRRDLNNKNIFREKDRVLYEKQGRPDPDKYKFEESEVQDSIDSLNKIIVELGGDPSGSKDKSDYSVFANPKE